MKKLIVARNIHKQLGDVKILKNIDLEINAGEIIAIVGPSGAGKTSLLQILGTLSSPDKAPDLSLEINDTDILNLTENELSDFRNQELGFIFQFHELLPEFNALENVMIPAFIKGTSIKDAEKRATSLIDQLGLSGRSSHKPAELSGGEQQRVAVARALMNNPSIIFADEPSGNLDSQTADQLHQLFFDLRDQYGHTFVIVTHNKELAEKADRKIELIDGKIVR
ncbi:MAG: ABC transporter ATP-binding protein [Flavobacteriales bacterium]|tara:strand:+ start:1259 stop:1930 length:672 start_codon:yes stop_codon:yes gene_type:complete